jgi:hypothetical protein
MSLRGTRRRFAGNATGNRDKNEPCDTALDPRIVVCAQRTPHRRDQAPHSDRLPIEGDVASNLADKRHVTTCLSRGDYFFGIGRTVLGSATYRF